MPDTKMPAIRITVRVALIQSRGGGVAFVLTFLAQRRARILARLRCDGYVSQGDAIVNVVERHREVLEQRASDAAVYVGYRKRARLLQ